MTNTEIQELISLIKQEVIPAIGCTEPIAVSLCVAKATETLGCLPDSIEVVLSANVLKNAMGVGIPGTGMIGLPIAISLGAIGGKSEYMLEVLKDCDTEKVEAAKKYIDKNTIIISQKTNITEKLYIEAVCKKDNSKARVIIAGGHTNFVFIQKDDNIILDTKYNFNKEEEDEEETTLSLRRVYDFATTAPLEDIRFILDTAKLNRKAAEASFNNKFGHSIGLMMRNQTERSIFGNSTYSKIISYTSGACDARMAGAMVPVMSNSGSGNQGISATMPVVVYAEENGSTEEQLIRALVLSHLTVIYIKQSLGRLSALCGCVVSASGSSCGIVLLMGGGYDEVALAVKNMVATLTGMLCDGAKPSCSMKVATGASTALLSAVMAMEQKGATSVEGIIDEDVDQCIRNLTKIGSKSMNETDKTVLNIMTSKNKK